MARTLENASEWELWGMKGESVEGSHQVRRTGHKWGGRILEDTMRKS